MHLAYSITTDFLAFKGAVCKKIFFFLSPLHPIRQTAIAVKTMHKLSLSPEQHVELLKKRVSGSALLELGLISGPEK